LSAERPRLLLLLQRIFFFFLATATAKKKVTKELPGEYLSLCI
jgi:hypothetical protein